MSYMIAHSPCFGCKKIFGYNPECVPSIRDPQTGEKEPICHECINTANPHRIANGLEPIHIHPMAYEPERVS